MKVTNKLILIGLCIILILPLAIAEQPWSNNATIKNALNITSQNAINENYTFKAQINGSSIGGLSDCSNLFVVYQDTTEVDREIQGSCDASIIGELNISFKMRSGVTIGIDTQYDDFSIWINTTTGFVPSVDPHFVYAFYENFSGSSFNTSNWDSTGGGCGAVEGGTMKIGAGSGFCDSDSLFEGNWSTTVNISTQTTNGYWGVYEQGTRRAGGAGQGVLLGGNFAPANKWTLDTLAQSPFKPNFHANLTLNTTNDEFMLITLTRNGTDSISANNDTSSFFINGLDTNNLTYVDPVIHFEASDNSHNVSEVYATTFLNLPPTIELLSDSKTLFQISPSESSTQNGINTNISCSATLDTSTSVNVTNFTYFIYNTSDALFNTTFADVSAVESNNLSDSFLINLTDPDGTWDWSCSITDTDNEIKSEGNISFILDTAVPAITLLQPILEGNLTNMLLSYSIVDDTGVGCFWSVGSSANQSQSCGLTNNTINTTTIDVNALGITYGTNQFSFYANDSLQNNNTVTREIVIVERIGEFISPTAIITETANFNLTIDDTGSVVTGANLLYNGTTYSAVLSSTLGTNKFYTADVPITATGDLAINWSITGIVNGTSDSHVYSGSTQSVGNLDIFSIQDKPGTCEFQNAQYTLNFTFRDEDTNGLVTGINTTAFYNAWTTSSSNSLNFSWTETQVSNSSYAVCLSPNFTAVSSTFKILYGGGDNTTREFNLQNHNLNNITQNYTLYLAKSADTDAITFNIVDSNGVELEDYEVRIYIRDFGNVTNPNFLVASLITDLNGQVVIELDTSEYYLIEIWKDGTLVFTVEPFIIQATTVTIVVPLQNIFNAKTITDMINGITTTLSYSNLTGNVTATWNDPDSLSTNFCLRTDNITAGSINAFSYACDSSSSGSLVQQVGNATGTDFLATIYSQSTSDTNYYQIASLDIFIDPTEGIFGLEGVYWGVMAIATIAMVAIPSVTGVVLTGLIGMGIMGYMLGFITIGWTIIAGLILVGGIIIVLVKD